MSHNDNNGWSMKKIIPGMPGCSTTRVHYISLYVVLIITITKWHHWLARMFSCVEPFFHIHARWSSIYTHTHICKCTRGHTHTYTHIHTCTYMYTYTHTHTHIYTNVHTHARTHARTHTHIQWAKYSSNYVCDHCDKQPYTSNMHAVAVNYTCLLLCDNILSKYKTLKALNRRSL